MNRTRQVTYGIGALLGLIALMVGIPAALIVLAGNPWPGWDALTGAFTTPDYTGSLFLGTLLPVIGWLAWASFALAVVVEIPATISHTHPPRLPALRLQQQTAAAILGSIAILFAPVASIAAEAVEAPPAAASTQHLDHATAGGQTGAKTSHRGSAEAGRPVWTVHRGDTLWDIAQATLGHGTRYREIVDLNSGVDQADGQHLSADHWLNPGWKLVLPDDAILPASGTAGGDTGHYTVHAGDTLTGIAEKELGDPGAYQQIAKQSHISNPNLIHPGQRLTIPGTRQGDGHQASHGPDGHKKTPAGEGHHDNRAASNDQPATGDRSTVQAPGTHHDRDIPAASSGKTIPRPDNDQVTESAHDQATIAPATLFTAGGLGTVLTAGIITVLGLKRAQQRRRRRPGTRIPLPAPDGQDAETEKGMRELGDPLTVEHVDAAVRWLTAWHQNHDQTLPGLYAARLTHTDIELYLTGPATLPTPFTATADDDTAWSIARTDIPALDETIPAPWPAMVTIGADPQGGYLLVDLEQTGALTINGRAEQSLQVLRALAIELGTSAWGENLQVTFVGFGDDLPAGLGGHRSRQINDVDHLVDVLEHRADNVDHALDQAGVDSVPEAKSHNVADDLWSPEVILIAQALTAGQQERIDAILTRLPRVGLAAVATTPLATPWALTLDDDTAELAPTGITLTPQRLDDHEYESIVGLLNTADRDDAETGPDWAATITTATITTSQLPNPAETPDTAVEPETDTRFDEAIAAATTTTSTGNETAPDADTATMAGSDVVTLHMPRPYIRLLGQVGLIGATGPKPQTKTGTSTSTHVNAAVALAAYLETHPGATRDDLHEAMWPKADPQQKSRGNGRRNELMSRLRRWLGETETGEAYLPRVGSDGYRLHPNLRTDWDYFHDLIGTDIATTPTGQLVHALKLVDGPPISGTDASAQYGSPWAWAEYLRQEIIAAIVDVAHEVTGRALTDRKIPTARLAATKARTIDPASEIAWRDALTVEHQAANPRELDRIAGQYRAHCEDIEADPDDDTLALIHRYTRKTAAAG